MASKALSAVELNQQALPLLIFFSVIFWTASYGWGQLGLPKDKRALLASCTASLIHGVPAALIAFSQIRRQWPIKVDAENTRENVQLLLYTLAYMLGDTVLYLIPYTPTDYLFCVHHLVVIAYISTTLMLGRGAMSCIVMLCFGECTSIWQNSWYICVELWGRCKWLDYYSVLVSWAYPGSYILARSIIGPPAVMWLCYKMQQSRLLPEREKSLWIAICLVSLLGSQLWSKDLLKTFWNERQHNPVEYAHALG